MNSTKCVCNYLEYCCCWQVVGSSLLLMYDDSKVGAWLIDFAKTRPVPDHLTVNHRSAWSPGNHEEGFLYGLDQLIRVMEQAKIPGAEQHPPPASPVALKSWTPSPHLVPPTDKWLDVTHLLTRPGFQVQRQDLSILVWSQEECFAA